MSKIIRNVQEAPVIYIGEKQRDRLAEAKAEARLKALFPGVVYVTTSDGFKLIPLEEVHRFEQMLGQRCDQARQEGYRDGYQAGVEKGLDEARHVMNRFEQAIADAVAQRAVLLEEARSKVLDLVLSISRKVTFEAVQVDREATAGMIHKVIDHLADRSRLRVKVHPDFLPVVRGHIDRFLAESATISEIEVEADPRVRDGGCLIETPSGDIDARLDSQFDVIKDALVEAEETD